MSCLEKLGLSFYINNFSCENRVNNTPWTILKVSSKKLELPAITFYKYEYKYNLAVMYNAKLLFFLINSKILAFERVCRFKSSDINWLGLQFKISKSTPWPFFQLPPPPKYSWERRFGYDKIHIILNYELGLLRRILNRLPISIKVMCTLKNKKKPIILSLLLHFKIRELILLKFQKWRNVLHPSNKFHAPITGWSSDTQKILVNLYRTISVEE